MIRPRSLSASAAHGRLFPRLAGLACCLILAAGVSFFSTVRAAEETSIHGTPDVTDADRRPVVRIGLIDTFSPGFYIHTYAATVQYLKRRLPQYRFESVEFASPELLTAAEAGKLDFLVSSAGTFGIRAEALAAEHIVILKRSDVKDASRSVASVFVVRSDNESVRTLADLRGKSVSATSPQSFDGWLIAEDAIAQADFNPEKFFSSVHFTEYNFPDVISRVLAGQTDAGILTRCELERMLAQGLVKPGAVRVINDKGSPEEACRRSTDLYPAEIIAVFPHTNPVLAKEATIALLQMPPGKGNNADWEWVTVNDLVNVSGLMERLSLGSFAYQKEFTFEALLRRYYREVILVLALIAATIFHILRVDSLVMQRTRELVRTVHEKEALVERMKRTQEYLQLLERNTIVSQLSNLFAHEMKQPVTNIINYAAGLQMLRQSGRENGPTFDQALGAISDQAQRIAQIVDRVRAYARHQPLAKTPCVLVDIVQAMLENFRMAQNSACTVSVEVAGNIRVVADPVALELLLLNLVRNAARAAAKTGEGKIFIRAQALGRSVRITISDNGPRVNDDLFARLSRIGGVTSAEGLGMGLAIAKGIAENHNGHLEFSRSASGGLAVTLVMPAAERTEPNATAAIKTPS